MVFIPFKAPFLFAKEGSGNVNAVSDAGNVDIYAAEKAQRLGAKGSICLLKMLTERALRALKKLSMQ